MALFLPRRDDAARAEFDDSLDRLRAYVGGSWDSHYRDPFTRLLHGTSTGATTGWVWTWNWPAALLPAWFLYRRLHAAFFALVGAYVVLLALDAWPAVPGLAVLQGLWGDRLLFRKALGVARATDDRALLAARGRPNGAATMVFGAAAVAAFAFLGSRPEPEAVAANVVATAPAVATPPDEPPARPAAPRVVTAFDGRSQVTLPQGWSETSERTVLSEFAEIQVGNGARDEYAVVSSDSKHDLPNVSLRHYGRVRMGGIRNGLARATVSEPRSLTIDGKPALQYRVRGTADYMRLAYWLTFIEGEERFYTVIGWSRASRDQAVDPAQQALVESFRELPEEEEESGEPSTPGAASS